QEDRAGQLFTAATPRDLRDLDRFAIERGIGVEDVHLERAGEAADGALDQREAGRQLTGIAHLVDQRRDPRAALGEVVDRVGGDAEELRAAQAGHVLGEARLARRAAQQREAFLGGVERLGDQGLAVT